MRLRASVLLLPPPNRNRPLPILITLLTGRNPRIRGFSWGRVGVGGREVLARRCPIPRAPPKKAAPCPPHKGEGRGPYAMATYMREKRPPPDHPRLMKGTPINPGPIWSLSTAARGSFAQRARRWPDSVS